MTTDQTIPPLPPHVEPLDVPTEGAPVQVYVELGVPILFDPATREFSAKLSEDEGRGSESRLHSQDFSAVLSRIRQRCLVTPVDAFLVMASTYSSSPAVEVSPCTVVEHHPKRQRPFVVSAVITRTHRDRYGREETKRTRRLQQVSEVYLPQPEQIDRLRDAVQAIRDEEDRHKAEMIRLRTLSEQAQRAITRLSPAVIRSVQQTGRQQAAQAASLGSVVFDLHVVPDEEEDEEDATTTD